MGQDDRRTLRARTLKTAMRGKTAVARGGGPWRWDCSPAAWLLAASVSTTIPGGRSLSNRAPVDRAGVRPRARPAAHPRTRARPLRHRRFLRRQRRHRWHGRRGWHGRLRLWRAHAGHRRFFSCQRRGDGPGRSARSRGRRAAQRAAAFGDHGDDQRDGRPQGEGHRHHSHRPLEHVRPRPGAGRAGALLLQHRSAPVEIHQGRRMDAGQGVVEPRRCPRQELPPGGGPGHGAAAPGTVARARCLHHLHRQRTVAEQWRRLLQLPQGRSVLPAGHGARGRVEGQGHLRRVCSRCSGTTGAPTPGRRTAATSSA